MRTPWSPLLLSLAFTWGCDDGASADPAALPDAHWVDAAGLDAAHDLGRGGADLGDAGRPDLGPDAQTVDAAPPDAEPPPDGGGCTQAPSMRPADGLQVQDCQWTRGGLSAPPRAVVLATDSLERAARTPLHEAEHVVELAQAGVDAVWVLVLWEGIEPQPGTFNGAYMGRICSLAEAAAAEGLAVVLTLYHQGFGVGAGGLGAPAWAGDGWAPFLADEGRAFEPAWGRLLDTCAEVPVDGLAFVGVPPEPREPARAYMAWVEAAAEARFGPLLSAWPAAHVVSARAADRVPLAVAAPVPGGSALPALAGAGVAFAGGLDARSAAEALGEVGAAGWTPVVWADGFGGPFSLRDRVGVPGPAFGAVFDTPWPIGVAGALTGWGPVEGGWAASWVPDQRNEGVSRFSVRGPAPVETSVAADPPVEAFAAFDPVASEITVYVAPGAEAARLMLRWEGE